MCLPWLPVRMHACYPFVPRSFISGGVESLSFDRASYGTDGQLADGVEAGDIGYDPLGLLPSDPEELEEIQNKEILNGRFAMISLAGMVAEELVIKEKFPGLDCSLSLPRCRHFLLYPLGSVCVCAMKHPPF